VPRLRTLVLGALALFLLIQLVPYGRAHTNPVPVASPRWDSPRTERLFADACGSCHSYETGWPWYSNVAPVSWLVQSDVDGGRESLDVSRWKDPQPPLDEILEVIDSGEMPPLQFRAIHGEARLSSSENQALMDGLRRTWATSPPGG
jgi:mono/diheme cytochrome c family protein